MSDDADVQQGVTVDLVLQYHLDVQRIYDVYVEAGGMSSQATVLRYLTGSSGLPQLQRDLVAHAVNEELIDPYSRAGLRRMVRAPYSSASVAAASGHTISEFDGERLAEHRRRLHGSAVRTEELEAERMAALRASGLLDLPVTERLQRLPHMTRSYFGVMGAAFTLITDDALIPKSFVGTLEGAMPREETFCNRTIRQDGTLVIPDTLKDPRFKDSPFVSGPPFIRFYAGHPIEGPGGMRIGALCMIDDSPRSFSTSDEHKLRTLAALVQLEIWAPPS